MSSLPPAPPDLMPGGMREPSPWRDAAFVGVIVLASVGSSVFFAVLSVGWEKEALIPSGVIPFIVSLPASLYLVRLRRRIETLNRRLFDLARKDHLTGLLNRAAFEADVMGLRQEGALVLIDVDMFKGINDRFGHQAGDLVLRQIAGQIAEATPPGAVAARLGGEEYGIFLPGVDPALAFARADELRAAIAGQIFRHEDRVIEVTISAGVAGLAEQGGMDRALRLADRALYRAKGEGRNLVRLGDPDEGAAPPGLPLPDQP